MVLLGVVALAAVAAAATAVIRTQGASDPAPPSLTIAVKQLDGALMATAVVCAELHEPVVSLRLESERSDGSWQELAEAPLQGGLENPGEQSQTVIGLANLDVAASGASFRLSTVEAGSLSYGIFFTEADLRDRQVFDGRSHYESVEEAARAVC